MTDREAKLKLLVELIGADNAAKVLGAFNVTLAEGGEIAAAAADALGETASATDKLDDAQVAATRSAEAEADAVAKVGETAVITGELATAAAQDSANAIGEVVQAAEEESVAVAAAGRAGAEAGREIAESAKLAARSVNEIVVEWQETVDAVKAAGLAFDQDAAVESVNELAAAIRSSNDDLETQQAALHGLADQLAKDLAAVSDASKGSGEATTEQGKKMSAALASVKAEIKQVDAALRAVAPAGNEGGEAVRVSFLSVDTALKLANQSAKEAMTQLEETGRVPKGAIRELAEIIETVNIAMERSANTSEAATAEQIENVEALKVHLSGLTQVTNRQVNASGDNAVALQETHQQTANLAQSMGSLIGVFDKQQVVATALTGKVSSLAQAYGALKAQGVALKLNTFEAGASLAKYGGQFGAVLVAILAAVKAGTAFSGTTKENTDAVDGYLTRLKSWISLDVKSWIDGVNLALQGNRTSFNESGDSIRFRMAAERDGMTQTQAATVAAEHAAKAWKFYSDAQKGGAEGHELWTRAVRESNGDAEAFIRIVDESAAHMQRAVRLTEMSTAAREKETTAARDLRQALDELDYLLPNAQGNAAELDAIATRIDAAAASVRNMTQAERERIGTITETIRKGADLTAAEVDLAQALLNSARAGREAGMSLVELTAIQAAYQRQVAVGLSTLNLNTIAAAQAISDATKFEAANNGTTASIKMLVGEIEKYIALGPAYAKETGVLASALDSVLDRTTRLEPAQRANIEAYAELAKKTTALTDAEKVYAVELLKSIERGGTKLVTMKAQAAATTALAAAVQGLADAENATAVAEAGRIVVLRSQLDMIEEIIAQQERAQGVSRDTIQTNQYEGASLDFLRMKREQLTAEVESSITVWHAADEAKTQEIATSDELFAALGRQQSAIEGVKKTAGELHAVIENGRVIYTNLTDAQRAQAEATASTARAAATAKLDVDKLNDTLATMRTNSDDAGRALGELVGRAEDVAAAMDKARESIRLANEEAAKAARE